MSKKKEQGNEEFNTGEVVDGRREERAAIRAAEDLDGPLEGGGSEDEDGFGPEESDEQTFVRLSEPGETFDGVYLRHVAKGDGGLKYAGILFAEYPSGNLKVVSADWSISERIAQKEREDERFFKKYAVRITLKDIVKKKDDASVKLYGYRFAPIRKGFRVNWTEQFPETK